MDSPRVLGEHGSARAGGGRDGADDEAAALGRVSITTLIERLLIPQHRALRGSLADLRLTAAGLVGHDDSRAHVLRRAATMIDELADVLLQHLDHEEGHVFPILVAGVAPIHDLGDLHDHHADIDGRLARLRALTAELISPAEVSEHTVVLFESLASFLDLAQRHHAVEHGVLVARYG